METTYAVGAAINDALNALKMSQRELARLTGMPQARLSRIISGAIPPSAPELLVISEQTGVPFARLSGVSQVRERVQYAARSTENSDMSQMRDTVLGYLELNDYLDEYAIY